MRLNIIHLPYDDESAPEDIREHRKKRWDNLMKELSHQKIDYRIWDGIKTTPGKVGCSQSHKKIIRDAKEIGLDYCIVAEDDLCFYGSGAWDYFIKNIPDSFDLYLGGYSGIKRDKEGKVKSFSSTGLYICHSRFYDKFLSVPESLHLDNALSMAGGEFIVCDPCVAYQMAGYSEVVDKEVNYTAIFNKQPKFTDQ